MRKSKFLLAALFLLAMMVTPMVQHDTANAANLTGETFTGISTPNGAWISGGSGSVACLTAATTSAAGSIPACPGGPIDSPSNGALRLTPNAGGRSGFAIYNTPISAGDGLNIEFDMFQYGGSGADGISFFLIDGSASPTQPGAPGGSLGYASASNGAIAGIDGGYVGIGFDRFGNFTSPVVGSGGPGAQANSIGVRGSEATGYQYVTHTAADSSLSGTTRANSTRKVRVTISTNNIMNVAVNYGSGYVTELADIDLNSINGEDSLPEDFKFGFAASTGGSTNTHEIRGLTVDTNPPNVSVAVGSSGTFVQGGSAQFSFTVANGSSAEDTLGSITVNSTLPAGLTPTGASGTGWDCNVTGQDVTCSRPGDGANALVAGASTPPISVNVSIGNSASGTLDTTASVATAENSNPSPSDTESVTVLAGSFLDDDGIFNSIEDGAPNGGDGNDDGTADSQQDNVTSLVNPVTGAYAVLESSGCSAANEDVSIAAESDNAAGDGSYAYPVGLMDFTINCAAPGDTATVTQYYFGTYSPSQMTVRKYNSVTDTYTTIPDATITTVTIGGQPAMKIVYEITDGGALDEDGTENGAIVDPSGPALLSSTITAPGSTSPTATSPAQSITAPNTGLPEQSIVVSVALILAGLAALAYCGLTSHSSAKSKDSRYSS